MIRHFLFSPDPTGREIVAFVLIAIVLFVGMIVLSVLTT